MYHFTIQPISKLLYFLPFHLNIFSLLFFNNFLFFLSPLSLSFSQHHQRHTTTSAHHHHHHHHWYNKTQLPPHPTANSHLTQQPTTTTNPSPTNPTTNHHSTAIATITGCTHNLCKSLFPPPKTKSKTQQTNIKTTSQTQHHHKSQAHVRNHRPKIRKSIFFKFLTQNQITKPTQTQPHLSKPSHARRTTATQPPRSIAETHKPQTRPHLLHSFAEPLPPWFSVVDAGE